MSADFPSVDESRDRLRRAGWSLGEACLAGAWLIGHLGKYVRAMCV